MFLFLVKEDVCVCWVAAVTPLLAFLKAPIGFTIQIINIKLLNQLIIELVPLIFNINQGVIMSPFGSTSVYDNTFEMILAIYSILTLNILIHIQVHRKLQSGMNLHFLEFKNIEGNPLQIQYQYFWYLIEWSLLDNGRVCTTDLAFISLYFLRLHELLKTFI